MIMMLSADLGQAITQVREAALEAAGTTKLHFTAELDADECIKVLRRLEGDLAALIETTHDAIGVARSIRRQLEVEEG
jgi:hypothetical protein